VTETGFLPAGTQNCHLDFTQKTKQKTDSIINTTL